MKYIKRFFKEIIIILLIITSSFELFFILQRKEESFLDLKPTTSAFNDSIKSIDKDDDSNLIKVDVKGEVKKPGVYEIKDTLIINDVIKLAGGLTKNGSTKNINLSKKVKNEMVIYICSKKELNINNTSINNQELIENKNINIPEIASKEVYIENEERINDTNEVNNSNTLININSASKEELLTLTGIGEAKAEAIIQYRNENKFKTIDDIKNISGIGDSLFAKIKDYITV